MLVKIYQIDRAKDEHRLMFRSLKAFEPHYGDRIPAEIYKLVYSAHLDVSDPEEVFAIFNVRHPDGFTGHSLSVSDVVEFADTGVYYFCDMFSFAKVRFAAE